MSYIHQPGLLATYNSLTDKNLSSYFASNRMRRHLYKAGLKTKEGAIVSENKYRQDMAEKEKIKYDKDLLAQAIVHKCLELERTRQVEMKNRKEEIAKLELVRRVRERRYAGDTRGQYHTVINVDENEQPLTKRIKDLMDGVNALAKKNLDSKTLNKLPQTLSKIEQGEGLVAPYTISLIPTPSCSARNSHASQNGRFRQCLRTADARTGYDRRSSLQELTTTDPISDCSAAQNRRADLTSDVP